MERTSINEPSAFVRASMNGVGRPVSAETPSTQETRFGAYFPRVFACALSLTGDEAAAKEVTCGAFSQVLARSTYLTEDEFVVQLFATARDLARSSRAAESKGSSLTGREQELLAFVFDARLTHEEIRRLMRTTEQALSAALLRALRKLRSGIAPPAVTPAHSA